MSRKLHIARNIFIIVLVIGLYLLVQLWAGAFLSREALFEHWERANHYGPAEEIILSHETSYGRGVVVGKYDDGVIVLHCKKNGILWSSGSSHYISSGTSRYENGRGEATTLINAAYGWTPDSTTEEVFYYFSLPLKTGTTSVADTVKVDKEGFFFKSYDDIWPEEDDGNGTSSYIQYLEGHDTTGNVIWSTGIPFDSLRTRGLYKALNDNHERDSDDVTGIAVVPSEKTIKIYFGEFASGNISEGTYVSEEEGYFTYMNHIFRVIWNDVFMYTGSRPEGPALEGVKPGTVFVLE